MRRERKGSPAHPRSAGPSAGYLPYVALRPLLRLRRRTAAVLLLLRRQSPFSAAGKGPDSPFPMIHFPRKCPEYRIFRKLLSGDHPRASSVLRDRRHWRPNLTLAHPVGEGLRLVSPEPGGGGRAGERSSGSPPTARCVTALNIGSSANCYRLAPVPGIAAAEPDFPFMNLR